MKKIIVIAFAMHVCLLATAQNFDKKIEQIFKDWNQAEHPGGVVSVMKNDELVLSKAYGKANIKYDIPNTTETVFNIGSVSKQFTAMGIVLLQLQGKLSFDDTIQQFLPELHTFGSPVTIRHLLHHTSGFRSTPELFGLAGWRDGDAISTEDDYRYFIKQKELNFEPGTQFMYSNSGYVLLAKIIENITGAHYNQWMQENIFRPLKMNETFVDEANSSQNKNVATGYNELEQDQFTLAENTSLDIGASNIYSTANDLTIWMKNFRQPAKGWEKAFELLQTTDKLADGTINKYAFGLMLDDFFGNKSIAHPGGVPGFLSFASYFPDEELTLVMLSNYTSREVEQKFMMLSQVFLKNKTETNKPEKPLTPISLDKEAATIIAGDYWNVKENYARKIDFEKDTLWYIRSNGSKSQLIQTGTNEFIIGGIKAQVIVRFETGSTKRMHVSDEGKPVQLFEEYDNIPISNAEMEGYTGSFYSTELETTYNIFIQNGMLMGYHSRHGDFPIERLKRGVTDWSGFAITNYEYNDEGEVLGMYVSLNRVLNVWFEKVGK